MTKTIAEIIEEHKLVIVSFNEAEFCVKRRDTKEVIVVAPTLTELMDKIKKIYG